MRIDCYTPTSNSTKHLYHPSVLSYLNLKKNSSVYTIINSIDDALQDINNIVISIVSDKNYVHNQPLPLSVWAVAHNLNKFPAVTIVTTSGDEVEGDIYHVNNNNVIITFSAPFAGKAYFN